MNETQMTLAVDLSGESRIDGWLASEKLNGCRAYWTGKEFFTRSGNVIHAPAWFTKGLPDLHLDGEINAGRDGTHGKGSFEVARVAVQHGGKWFDEVSPLTATPLRFSVFDCPQVVGTWSARMAAARRALCEARHAAAVAFARGPAWSGQPNSAPAKSRWLTTCWLSKNRGAKAQCFATPMPSATSPDEQKI